MIIRAFKPSDLEQIADLHKKYQYDNFSMPDIAEAYADIVAEEAGQIIAYGQNREITEAIMLLDLDKPLRMKSEALSSLIRESIFRAKLRSHDQIHAFIQDPNFENALKKHYGFRDTKGKALVSSF